MLTDQSWVLTPPPTASHYMNKSTNWCHLCAGFCHFLSMGILRSFQSSRAETRGDTRRNTHRSLTAGQLLLLAEPATGGRRACHFPGVGHQLRGGQLRGFLGVSNKKPETKKKKRRNLKCICHQILLSHSRVSFGVRRHELSSFYHPQDIWTNDGDAIILTTTPYTPVAPI